MDVNLLKDRIQSTLDANADIRRQAELDLRYAEEQPGFLSALLDILQADVEINIRQSAAIYLKNRINAVWETEEPTQQKERIEEEKTNVRNRILPLLASSPRAIRAPLLPALTKILHADFPSNWPNFLELTLGLLNTNDAASVLAGLYAMQALSRLYRFKGTEAREQFNQIIEASFPLLLNVANGLISETSIEAWEMLHILLKVYKHAVYFQLTPFLMAQDQMVRWCTLFLTIVGKDAPEHALDEDLDERERSHFWKSKKWAYANLNRLFIRYGNPSSVQKNTPTEMADFSKYFIANFAPEILKVYFQQIEKWASKTTWLSKPSLSYTLIFLDDCIKPKSTWDNLKPHVDTLIAHVLFPILCQTDEDIELFDSDPPEYLHRKLNFYEEVSAPDVAATNFLVSLTKSRKKLTYTILTFVNGIVSKYESAPEDQKNPREKEGALRMIGTLASVILSKKSPIADQVEYFFVRHVFPEFRSPHGFLRARACDTLGKFEQLEFKDPNNLVVIYQHILQSMADPALPVRVEAALALQPLIRHDVIRSSMQSNIPQIMQQLLKLANEVDVDALANVMEEFVEEFAAELTPFAVALSEQLRDTYLRIVRELVERNNSKDGDEGYGDFLDDKSITALGVLQTIGTLILTLEATPDVLMHLETILMPVIEITLENKLFDLYNEVFEIIDSCTFSAKAVSPTMWRAFELMHKTFKAGAELYLEDMVPALDNFVSYGTATMIANPSYVDAIVGMVSDIFQDDKLHGMDRICGCKLAEAITMNLRGHVDRHIPLFIGMAMKSIGSAELKVKAYRVHLLEMVVNAIYYNPVLALQILESNGWTNKFFSSWFSNIETFTRVHDKKLSIVAISALLTLNANEVPTSVQQGWPRLLQGIVRIFQTLPAAEKNREEVTRESDFQTNDTDEEEDVGEWDEQGDGQEENETEDVKDESAAYLEFLTEEAQKFGALQDDSDDELEEESLLETPLDKIEPYSVFKAALFKLQQEQPQLYDNLTKILNPDEQQIVQHVVVKADELALAAQAQASARAQASEATAAPTSSPYQVNGSVH